MGQDDNINASIAHLILCCVAGRGVSRISGHNYINPGMHANFFIHGVLGFFHYQSDILSNDLKPAYTISYAATKYLPLPCLMADIYRSDTSLSAIHLLSGVIPFTLTLAGNENHHLGHLVIACNLVSLSFYAFDRNKEWAWYTAASAFFAYFMAFKMGTPGKIMYPLGLALMEYCAYNIGFGDSAPLQGSRPR